MLRASRASLVRILSRPASTLRCGISAALPLRPRQLRTSLSSRQVPSYRKEYNATATHYRHRETGAEVVSVCSTEVEKVFGIAFRTPVSDSRGVPHIIEHSVLCGSRKYPVKEPFVELLKSSLQTYLNAMTYPDRTVYPVASPNLKDFYHLVDVYLDATLRPRLEPWVLAQEGWHLEVSKDGGHAPAAAPGGGGAPGGRLGLKGVVYNEMKGVYSSADSVHSYAADAALFPDTEYAHASGGDPLCIPDLRFEDFAAYHARHYHPSNARAFFFGDDDPVERLRLLDEHFAGMGPGPGAGSGGGRVPGVAVQPLWSAPRRAKQSLPAADGAAPPPEDMEGGEGDEVEEAAAAAGGDSGGVEEGGAEEAAGAPASHQHELSVNWVLHEGPLPCVDRTALGVLNHLLLRTDTAPLYKALTDSGLGAAVVRGGLDDGLLQATFGIGLKGVAAEDVPKVEPLILETLEKIAAEGFSPEHLAATLNTIEFSLREFSSGGGPRGLSLLLSALPGWLYGRDPLDELRFEAPMAAFRERLAAEPGYLQSLIRHYLLSNTHRLTLHGEPDPSFHATRAAAEAARLAALEAAMTPADLARVEEEAEALRQRQATPDSPEALACIPSLQLSDVPLATAAIPRVVKLVDTVSHAAAAPLPFVHLLHEQPTAGIGYTTLYFDLSALPQTLLPLLPIFTWALTQCGAGDLDETQLAHRIGTVTGGIGAGTSVMEAPRGRRDAALPFLTVSGKALTPRLRDTGDLMRDVLLGARLDVRPRLLTHLRDTVAAHESGLVAAGHRYAASLLASAFTKAAWANDAMGGLGGFHAQRALLAALQAPGAAGDAAFAALIADLEAIRRAVLCRSSLAAVSSTGDAESLRLQEAAVAALVEALPWGPGADAGAVPHALGRGWVWPWQHPSPSSNGPHHGHGNASCELLAGGHVAHCDWPTHSASALGAFRGRGDPAAADGPPYIGLVVPTQVNYVVKAAPAYPAGEGAPGSAEVASHILNTGHLWERVRVQGGAYGGSASLNRHSGILSFSSYRDPNLRATLQAFDESGPAFEADYGAPGSQAARSDDLRKAAIATIGSIDAPLSPAERGDLSTARFLSGISDGDVQQRRAGILGVTAADVAAFARGPLQAVAARGRVCVVGSEAAFAQYADEAAAAGGRADAPQFELVRPLQQRQR